MRTLLDSFGPELDEKKKAMYENVLKFPLDTDHVKYFEKIPHPDKIDPGILAILNATPKQDLNAPLLRRQLEFENVRRYLEKDLDDMDYRILHMPGKMQEWLDDATDEEYKQAFRHLRDTFYNYFATPLEEDILPGIQWIDYNFAIDNYAIAQEALQDLKANLFNDKAVEKLKEKLLEADAFGKEVKPFYFWNTDPHNWSDISYQSRSVKHEWGNFKIKFSKYLLPPQYKALCDFTINAIPEGRVVPKGHGNYDICVDKMFFFVNDLFNFEGPEFLWIWDLPTKQGGSKYTFLENPDLRRLQRHGYGRNIPVLSRLHEMEDFEPKCIPYHNVK